MKNHAHRAIAFKDAELVFMMLKPQSLNVLVVNWAYIYRRMTVPAVCQNASHANWLWKDVRSVKWQIIKLLSALLVKMVL